MVTSQQKARATYLKEVALPFCTFYPVMVDPWLLGKRRLVGDIATVNRVPFGCFPILT
jgi:hypothetical protein